MPQDIRHLIKLARIARELEDWNKQLRSVPGFSDVSDPISGDYKLVDLTLDACGVPEQNFPEFIEDWVDGFHYCRDYWYDEWERSTPEEFVQKALSETKAHLN